MRFEKEAHRHGVLASWEAPVRAPCEQCWGGVWKLEESGVQGQEVYVAFGRRGGTMCLPLDLRSRQVLILPPLPVALGKLLHLPEPQFVSL